ncbi:hypothetical protein NBRC116597_19260 [Phaeobacter sp. NW0010-22]
MSTILPTPGISNYAAPEFTRCKPLAPCIYSAKREFELVADADYKVGKLFFSVSLAMAITVRAAGSASGISERGILEAHHL